MSDKPKVKITGTGSHDLSIVLPNGTNLIKELRIARVAIEFTVQNVPTLKLECDLIEDEWDINLEGLELERVDVDVRHHYPKDAATKEQIQALEEYNQEMYEKLWVVTHG